MSEDSGKSLSAAAPPHAAQKPFKMKIVWFNSIGFIVLHLAALYGVYLTFTATKFFTLLYTIFTMVLCAEGIGLGAHRMFSHRALKGTWAVRFTLIALQTLAGQNCLYIWVRDHRQHHKFSDTDADPHNSNRGFFFSHIGWLCCRKHPDVIEKGKTIDMSDLEADPLVMFQKRHYKKLYTAISLVLPTVVPCYFWDETLWNSFFVTFVLRVILVLNFTWLVNSAAHAFGNRPFTKSIVPVETGLVSFLTMGEGWHNYHHTFPFDYRASEYGQYLNVTTKVIHFLEQIGWVYDLRTATPEMVIHRILKQGDGTHPKLKELAKKYETMKQEAAVEDQSKLEDIIPRQKQRVKGSD